MGESALEGVQILDEAVYSQQGNSSTLDSVTSHSKSDMERRDRNLHSASTANRP